MFLYIIDLCSIGVGIKFNEFCTNKSRTLQLDHRLILKYQIQEIIQNAVNKPSAINSYRMQYVLTFNHLASPELKMYFFL